MTNLSMESGSPMKTSLHILTLLTALLLAPLAALHAADAAPKPNILFIMVDEMKWNVMSCAGHPIVKTPNLDRLAREGTRFATAYTVAPICTPSRYSFFTGRYAHVHGSTDNSTPPREPQVLLPAILKHHGYQTAISGKLHFIPNNSTTASTTSGRSRRRPRQAADLAAGHGAEARPQRRSPADRSSPSQTTRSGAISASSAIPRRLADVLDHRPGDRFPRPARQEPIRSSCS